MDGENKDILRMRRIKNVGCGFNAYVKLLCGYPS